MIQINTFDMINIKSNTLILSDIDETILMYDNINPSWWKDKNKYYMNIYNDQFLTNSYSLNDWFRYIQYTKPNYTDKIGFENMLKKIKETNSTLMFITARNPKFKKITQEHFNYLKIDYSKYKIHYLTDISKGEYIKNNIDISKYNQIIFIDDLIKNIISVTDFFKDKIKTYHFIEKYNY